LAIWNSVPTELSEADASKLAALVKDAWQKMRDAAATDNVRIPTVMTALLVGQQVYFASSVTCVDGGSAGEMVKLLREPIRGGLLPTLTTASQRRLIVQYKVFSTTSLIDWVHMMVYAARFSLCICTTNWAPHLRMGALISEARMPESSRGA